jgi:fructose 1,6-bisphosphate aldolase/phosphatase
VAERSEKVTLSVLTADVGGFVGHLSSHPEVLDTAKERLYNARQKGLIVDFHVLRCGDDLELVITHRNGLKSPALHDMATDVFHACKDAAALLKLHSASFGGEKAGDSSFGVAELEFRERESEPVLVLMANKVLSGAWNLPVYRIFADPFNTAGLLCDPVMMDGFSFRVIDIEAKTETVLKCPEDGYALLTLIGSTSRFSVSDVARNSDNEPSAMVGVRTSGITEKGPLVRSEPSMIVRCQMGLPSAGEVMEAFAFPHLVKGWLRGSFNGPLMPVPFYESNPSRFDGPPRLIGAGFQVSDGRLIGPHDLFDDPSFDPVRQRANEVSEYLRRHGPFEPHRLSEHELKDTASSVLDKIKGRSSG